MSYMRKIAIVAGFFIGTPLVLILAITFLSYMTFQNTQVLGSSTRGVAYAALPPADESIQNTIGQKNSEEEILRQFFEKYNSPLEPFSADFIAASNRHDIDFRLLPAIAMQESTLCKKIITGSHNCWGWGIYGGKVIKFSNYPEAIETITKSLSIKYRNQGLVTVEEIAKLYNPSNTNNWVENVRYLVDQLE